MKNDMNSLFGDFSFFFDDMFPKKTHEVKTIGENVILSLIAPGHKKESFSVKLEGDKLYITMPEDTKKTFRIPPTVSTDDISAEYVAGILKIKFNKQEVIKREITIL